MAFFTTDGGGYTIFLRSRAQKWQFSLAQREQNCYFAPAAKKNSLSKRVEINCSTVKKRTPNPDILRCLNQLS